MGETKDAHLVLNRRGLLLARSLVGDGDIQIAVIASVGCACELACYLLA